MASTYAKACCCFIASAIACPACAGSAAAPRIEQSTISINAAAANIYGEGMQGGSSSSKSLFGKKKSSSSPDLPGQVDVGVVDLTGGTVIRRTHININAVANGVYVRGGTIRIGSIVAAP